MQRTPEKPPFPVEEHVRHRRQQAIGEQTIGRATINWPLLVQISRPPLSLALDAIPASRWSHAPYCYRVVGNRLRIKSESHPSRLSAPRIEAGGSA
uniref:Transposase n=1 Tax=Steinernema glaseri TaxID=37863 RepID=A0A1I7YB85_9BILA